jgi:dienelactone hydrolase
LLSVAQFKQVCDKLAAAGYLVVGPDVFRGKPWSMGKFPPKPEDNFMAWLQGFSWNVSRIFTLLLPASMPHKQQQKA